ncbi:hypothetical protein OH76DRAFT_1422427 [Lentinus brumalis]|uniref:C2H2-type domain-containing protein n=1 Tax=Lentinus brumalis TaxID=2498619 RepID=A0A371CQL6_9APHY|nr:hypothetical protein OH76DRAFT_1422427 [Polyporus brumalis]
MSVGGSFNDGNVLYTNSEIPVHAPYQDLVSSSSQLHEGHHTDPSDPSALHLPHPASPGSQTFLPQAELSVASDELNTYEPICLERGCGKLFANKHTLKRHQYHVHGLSTIQKKHKGTYACTSPGCTKSYWAPYTLRRHMLDMHAIKVGPSPLLGVPINILQWYTDV